MKALFFSAVVLLIAATGRTQLLVVNPSHAPLVVGQSIGIAVSNHAGFTTPYPVMATFSVSGPLVIDRIDTITYGGKLVIVRALALGDGTLNAEKPDGTSYGAIATFNVTTCDRAEPHVTLLVNRIGDEVDADAIAMPVGGTYEWFFGPVGDTSRPMSTIAPAFTWFYTAHDQPAIFWVRYTTICGVAIAQEGSTILRRRPSRH